jgi:hypothetical protein
MPLESGHRNLPTDATADTRGGCPVDRADASHSRPCGRDTRIARPSDDRRWTCPGGGPDDRGQTSRHGDALSPLRKTNGGSGAEAFFQRIHGRNPCRETPLLSGRLNSSFMSTLFSDRVRERSRENVWTSITDPSRQELHPRNSNVRESVPDCYRTCQRRPQS